MGEIWPLHDGGGVNQEGTAPTTATGSGTRVVVRRSSSTSMVVVEQSSYEMRSQQEASQPTNVDLANSSRTTRRKPITNYSSAKANSNENANTTAAAADDEDACRVVSSRVAGLPPTVTGERNCAPSQPGVNQHADSTNNKGNHNNNEGGRHSQWIDSASERKQRRRPIVLMAAGPQNGNKIGERANYYPVDVVVSASSANGNGRLMSRQASDYSSLHTDTPDLGPTLADGFCEGAQMDRAHFYHNLPQPNASDDVRLFALEHEPGWRAISTRSSTLPATPRRVATAATATKCASNGSTVQVNAAHGHRQQVRPSDDVTGARRSRARAPAGAGRRGATRMGKFVNYYPAERQPLGVISPGRKRHTSPYAFHVPADRQQQQRPVSRTRSPLYHYSPAGQQQQLQQQQQKQQQRQQHEQYYDQLDDSPVEDETGLCGLVAEVKQARYGYVAPIERQQRSPVGRFNKSFRSRTIGHIPSMVQVSVDDNSLAAASRRDSHLATAELNNRSEGDLLRAHRIAWHQSNKFDVGHDNPFRPGTELSLEADLMVRLIKRGYPIGELPHLVEATKSLMAGAKPAQARAKSCDKLLSPVMKPDAGYLDYNLRQFNESRHQGQELAAPNDSILHSHSYSHFTQANKQVDELEPCKRVWANSLSRAKSMPRFNYSAGQSSAGLEATPRTQTRAEDADSLDKLITNIEQEIGNLLGLDAARNKKNCDLGSISGSINDSGDQTKCLTNSPSGGLGNKGLSKRRTGAQSDTLSQRTQSEQARKQLLPSSTSTPSFNGISKSKARIRNDDLTSSRSNELLLTEALEGKSRVIVTDKKRKKSRCCLIL